MLPIFKQAQIWRKSEVLTQFVLALSKADFEGSLYRTASYSDILKYQISRPTLRKPRTLLYQSNHSHDHLAQLLEWCSLRPAHCLFNLPYSLLVLETAACLTQETLASYNGPTFAAHVAGGPASARNFPGPVRFRGQIAHLRI